MAVRRGELLASLSLAIDLGLGMPMETMLRTALVALRLARVAGLPDEEANATYYLALLRFVGCTSASHDDSLLFGDELGAAGLMSADDSEVLGTLRRTIGRGESPHVRALRFGKAIGFATSGGIAVEHRMHCEAAVLLGHRLAMPADVLTALPFIYARWDGRGTNPASDEGIPRAMRVVHVAQLAAILSLDHSSAAVGTAVLNRAGRQLDPALAKVFEDGVDDLLAGINAPDVAMLVLAADPSTAPLVGADLDRALEAVADFGDIKTPHMLGHSRRVAELAARAASRASLPAADIDLVRRAGLVHDVGRVGVPEKLWIKTGPLAPAERERIRFHSYLTERVFAAVPTLSEIGRIGGGHHERLDGSGYHRGTAAGMQPATTRLLAASNAWCALTEPRPHREMLSPDGAARELRCQVKDGRLDTHAVDAVLSAAGAAPLRRRAAGIGLSEREIEVLRLLARQQSNKDIARTLDISPKTVERHVTHIYDKIGVTTRAGAALYATDNGLL